MGAIQYTKVAHKVSTSFKNALLLLHPHVINRLYLSNVALQGFLILSSSKWASAKNWIQGWTGPQAGSCGTHWAMPNPRPYAALSISYLFACFSSLLLGPLAQMLGNTWHRNTSHFTCGLLCSCAKIVRISLFVVQFCNTGYQTQSLTHSRQAVYYWAIPSHVFFGFIVRHGAN